MNNGRIYWKCRRGSLELDMILSEFYQKKFPDLTPDEQHTFDQLLDEDDPILSAWLFTAAEPNNPAFTNIIRKIKS